MPTTNYLSETFNADDIVLLTANMEWENHNGIAYLLAYTYGSAFNLTCKYFARAGWRVY